MKFLNFFKKKEKAEENYIGLFFKDRELEVFLYELQGKNILTLAHKTRPYTSGWDKITEDADDVLFAIEQETKVKFEKAIIFLHSHLVDNQTKQIKDPYKRDIKNLLKQLELQPLGYIECYEAVITHLQKRDHTLLNAILVEMDDNNIGTYLYMGGRQVYRHDLEKNTSIAHHLNEELARMKQDAMLPSRVILFGEHTYQKEIDEICAHEFETGHFIHVPKVELFTSEELGRALSDTFKDQMLDKEPVFSEPEEEDMTQAAAVPDENFEVIHTKPPHEATKKEVMGFVIGDEIGDDAEDDEDEPVVDPVASKSVKKAFALVDTLAFLKTKALGFLPFLKKIIPPKKGKMPYLIGAGVVILILGLFAIEYFFHKTELTVYFPSQKIDKNISVPAVLGDNDINLRIGTVSAQVTDKKATTGKRDVGDKAKGSVTVYNFEDQDRLFTKGTTLTASSHTFVLDQDVSVASASEVLISGGYVKQPGKSAGNIVASDLGPDSNLDKNTKFQIGDLSMSSYFAVNDNPLTGGTKKQVQTVAKTDIDALKKEAISEGTQQAEEDFKKVQSNKDEQVLGALTEAAPKKLDFSKEIGEEASEVQLSADIGVTYYLYSNTQMVSFLKKSLDPQVQSGFALPEEKIAYKVSDAKLDGEEVTLDVSAQGTAVRKFSKEEILKRVAGKDQSQLDAILKNDLKASGFEVKTKSAPFFFLANRLPFAKKNIDIKIDSL